MKYSCFTADSIRLMAEASCISELKLEVAALVSEDVTFRIRQIIGRAIKFMRHSNRTKLTCADINKALKWSDCQPIFGHESNPNKKLRYSYSTEAQVFRYEDDEVDLETYRGKPDPVKNLQEALPELRFEVDQVQLNVK